MNEDCGIFHEMPISTTQLSIKTENVSVQSMPLLKMTLGNNNVSYICIFIHYLNIKNN